MVGGESSSRFCFFEVSLFFLSPLLSLRQFSRSLSEVEKHGHFYSSMGQMDGLLMDFQRRKRGEEEEDRERKESALSPFPSFPRGEKRRESSVVVLAIIPHPTRSASDDGVVANNYDNV